MHSGIRAPHSMLQFVRRRTAGVRLSSFAHSTQRRCAHFQVSNHKKPAQLALNFYFVDLLRASLHFPSFRYMNSPQLRCPGTDSARYAALRCIEVGWPLTAPRALVAPALADA